MEIKNEKNATPSNEDLKKKWLITAGSGLALLGAGLCVFSEAAFAKHEGASLISWFGLGLLALILINAGISVFGNAVVQKSYMESRRRLAKRSNNRRKNYNKPRNKNSNKKTQDNNSN